MMTTVTVREHTRTLPTIRAPRMSEADHIMARLDARDARVSGIASDLDRIREGMSRGRDMAMRLDQLAYGTGIPAVILAAGIRATLCPHGHAH